MSITLDELIFDPANPDDGANVGATLRGADGTVIGNVADALKVTGEVSFASGSEVALDAATLAALETVTIEDGGGSITVDAVDLDIRDLSDATDSVAIGDGTNSLSVNADGSINVVSQGTACFETLQNSAQSVTTTASQITPTPLSGRKEITIQNLGSKDIWLGSTAGVTASNGIKLPRGASATYNWCDTATIFAVSDGTSDVRIMEAA